MELLAVKCLNKFLKRLLLLLFLSCGFVLFFFFCYFYCVSSDTLRSTIYHLGPAFFFFLEMADAGGFGALTADVSGFGVAGFDVDSLFFQ